MTQIETQLDNAGPDEIAREWQDELALYDPRSHEYQEIARSLGELGIAMPDATEIDVADELVPPAGFASMKRVRSKLPTDQFEGRVLTLNVADKYISTDTFELVTDTGASLRVSDIRSAMVSKAGKFAPKTEAEQDRLDHAFWRDMKIYAETGNPRNTVTDIKGVAYTKLNGTSMRTYWSAAEDEANSGHVRQVARLLDCGNSKSFEDKLYHEAFGRRSHK